MQLFTNNGSTALANAVLVGDTTITVVDASKFPAGNFKVTLETIDRSVNEIVLVTGVAGNVLTVTRAQEGTVASGFAIGSKVEVRVTAEFLNDLQGLVEGMVDDTAVATDKAYSSDKVMQLHTAQQEAIAHLSGASATFSSNVSQLVPEEPTAKVDIVWTNGQASSNASVLELGVNEVLFKVDGNYSFLTTLTLYRLSDGSVTTATFELYDADTGTVLKSISQAVDMTAGTKQTLPLNVLVPITGASEANPVRMKVRMGMTVANGTLELFSFSSVLTAQSVTGTDLIDDAVTSTTKTWSSDKVSAELDVKANQSTTYTKTEVDTALSGKANTTHSHTISDVTNLQTALDGKAASIHTHTIANVTGLQTALDGKLDATANAVSATKLATARTISLTGGVTGSASFDGSANASISVTVVDDSHNHGISNVDGLQTALDGKANSSHTHSNATTSTAGFMSSADKTKLDGVATEANNYVHPTGDGNLHVPATGTTNNGKVLMAGATAGSLSWTAIPAASVSSVAGKTGAVVLAKADVGLANVDNTSDINKPISNAVQSALDMKANVLHTHTVSEITDFVSAVDAKIQAVVGAAPAALDTLGEIATQLANDQDAVSALTTVVAGKADTIHTHGVGDVTGLQTALDGKLGATATAAAATKLATARTVTLSGTVSGSTAFDGTSNVTINTSVPNATTSVSGLMSNSDKSKLDGIATNANNYVHPTGDGNLHVPATGTTNSGKVLTAGSTAGSLSWTVLPAVPVTSVAGRTGAITLTKSDVGLGNVDNTADSAKAVLSATKLATARNIGGVSFDGTANISLPGVDTTGNQSTTGNAATATKLATARSINGVAFDGTANITINAVDSTARIAATEKGTANGVATLGADGKVPSTQLPSYVDDVLEFTNLASFPATGESGKIYVALDTNKTYRWGGSSYTAIASGSVDSVAGKTGAVTLVKADVGLGNVDNTSDANKPVSTATQTALNAKQNTITGAATTITSSNLTASMAMVTDASGKVAAHGTVSATELGYLDGVTSDIQTQLNSKAATTHTHAISDVTGLQTALDTKQDKSSILFSGNLNDLTTTGLYHATTALVNAPFTDTTSQIRISNFNGVIMQEWFNPNNLAYWYVREFTNAWGSWSKVLSANGVTNDRVLLSSNNAGGVVSSNVSSTELSYLGGVTSAIQTQLDGKEPTITTLPVSKGGTGANTLTGLVKGDGTSAMTAAVAGTDYVIPSGSITGNAATATVLQTGRTINGVSFNGSADITIEDSTKIPTTEKGAANGVATLDSGMRLPESQLPLALEQALAAINGV